MTISTGDGVWSIRLGTGCMVRVLNLGNGSRFSPVSYSENLLQGSLLFNAYPGSFPMIKRPEREVSACQYNSTYAPHSSSSTRVVTVLGRPGRDASQVEKSPRLNWATQFLTVAHDGACSPNVSVRMAWISFGALTCRGGKNLKTAHVLMLLKSRASPDMLSFSLCNKKRLAVRHMNRPLFAKTLSIPSYDVGK